MAPFVWTYPATVDRWIDGDTPICHIQISPSEQLHAIHVRVDGINAPELRSEGGPAARDYANELAPPGVEVTLSASRTEKYGRFLARLTLADGSDFGTRMIEAGHAVAYTP